MRILIPIALIILAIFPFVVGNIYQYSFPNEIYEGSKSPIFLYIISGILLSIAIFSAFPSFAKSKKSNSIQLKNRWLFLVAGFLMIVLGIFGALLFWYTPNLVGYSEPSPLSGVLCFIAFTVISSIFWYISSNKNSLKRPNLMRGIIVLIIIFWASQMPLTLSLILLYAFPTTPLTAYPLAATINFISYLVWGGLLLQFRRETKYKMANKKMHQTAYSGS